MKLILTLYFILMITLALFGCTTFSSAMTPIQAETQPSLPVFTLPMPTSTITLTATSTAIPFITLAPEEAKKNISELLGTTVDCEAPCFWGIMPGQTPIEKAESIFTHLGLQSKSTSYEGKDFYGIKDDLESGLSILVTLTVQNRFVDNLRVDIVPENQKVGTPREWLAYSPETLINRYGPPSKVEFFLDWGPRPYFEMDMYFDQVDLIVVYEGHNIIPREKSSPRVCPLTAQFESVRLWMGKDPYQPPRPAVSLDKATSMTLEEFANLMTGDPGKACFIVNGDAFR